MKSEQLSYRWGLFLHVQFSRVRATQKRILWLIKPTVRETDRLTGRQRHTYTHKHYLRLV